MSLKNDPRDQIRNENPQIIEKIVQKPTQIIEKIIERPVYID